MKTQIPIPPYFIACILAVAVIFLIGIVPQATVAAHIENCKHNASGDYVCVWTENETHMTIVARVMHDGKPAPFQPVVMRLYTQGSTIYTCDTVTGPLNAVCEFGPSDERTYSITANVAGATFLWFNGSWQ